MQLIGTFILRQHTRPSEEEVHELLMACLLSEFGEGTSGQDTLLALLTSNRDLRFQVANLPSPSDDIDQVLDVFIRAEGGARYLDDPRSYQIERYRCTSGENAEPTRIAMIYGLEPSPKGDEHLPDVDDFLTRGRRWEALEHWGDAVACYHIGLVLHPDHAALHTRLGVAQMHFPYHWARALKNLTRATELAPGDANALWQLGRCYRRLADTPEVPVQGRPREELRQMAWSMLERAAILDANNPALRDELNQLRTELGVGPQASGRGGFFS